MVFTDEFLIGAILLVDNFYEDNNLIDNETSYNRLAKPKYRFTVYNNTTKKITHLVFIKSYTLLKVSVHQSGNIRHSFVTEFYTMQKMLDDGICPLVSYDMNSKKINYKYVHPLDDSGKPITSRINKKDINNIEEDVVTHFQKNGKMPFLADGLTDKKVKESDIVAASNKKYGLIIEYVDTTIVDSLVKLGLQRA